MGIDRIRAVLVDDTEGEAARLDREIEAAVAAYRDPWQEGAAPAEPTQFRDSFATGDGAEAVTS